MKGLELGTGIKDTEHNDTFSQHVKIKYEHEIA